MRRERLDKYITTDSPLYSTILYLNKDEFNGIDWNDTGLLECLNLLNEERYDATFIRNNVVDKLVKTGRINLNGMFLNIDNPDDIIALSKAIDKRRFETGRVLYLRNNVVVGQSAATVDAADFSPMLYNTKKPNDDFSLDISAWFYKKEIEDNKADGYCIIHNHPSGDPTPSTSDIETLKIFNKYVGKPLASIIVGDNGCYSILTIDDNDKIKIFTSSVYKDDIESILNIRDLKNAIDREVIDKECTYIFYLNKQRKLIAILEIGNGRFNNHLTFREIRNKGRELGACYSYLYTFDESVYFMSRSFLDNGGDNLFLDIIYSGEDGYKTRYHNADDRVFIKDKKLPLLRPDSSKITKL